jgi:hypothetical protein
MNLRAKECRAPIIDDKTTLRSFHQISAVGQPELCYVTQMPPTRDSKVPKKATLSFSAALARHRRQRGVSMAPLGGSTVDPDQAPLLPIVAEVTGETTKLLESVKLAREERLDVLAEGFLSGRLYAKAARDLMQREEVRFVQSKTAYEAHVLAAAAEAGIRVGPTSESARVVKEKGKGVIIGVVDTGFDLSHPAFKTSGGDSRVIGLLDQVDGGEYTKDELLKKWSNGQGPGGDASGHGTHVASIAGGSAHQGYEGVAPEVRFLLVKTNFLDTDAAVAWVFRKAGTTPCVVNLSLGGHDGAHDGTGTDERLHSKLVGDGRIVVVAAGNDQLRKVHFGHHFYGGEVQEVKFDIFRPATALPHIFINTWSGQEDEFRMTLKSPDGTPFDIPVGGERGPFAHNLADIYFGSSIDPITNQTGARVEISFREQPENAALVGWRISIQCMKSVFGRLDGWIGLSAQGVFHTHPIVESSRTLSIPATGKCCIAVGSYTSSCEWESEVPPLRRQDIQAVRERFSRFTSLGPTRDGRWKPELSAAGEHICSALAAESNYAQYTDRAQPKRRLFSQAGTSMAAPVVTGVIALMLQKKNNLAWQTARDILIKTARRDAHTTEAEWSPAYGHGKLDARAALAKL